ncbi:PH domain-containing protein [Rhodococcus triatomae]|uniref:PH domain-containing protein n=1 Tax=Rhodococcus triatomae TaxID=300028 RepID=A0A1G8KDY4_9NOCA|nr:PH domain-containing protein [Rhodococcus triatomae]QNG18897.1 PH domain-containing protein [Rhodococcus triatomae]QNG25191.1 PH domain-containing protein [Rhodococcus triatomae]SDI41625.1 PH domain-containing protein [Rhodococcus triatomae]
MSGAPSADTSWELIARPRRTARYAMATAAVLIVVHVGLAITLARESTGVYFRLADQLAMAGIGLFLACLVLLLTRPRLRVSREGIAVRNVISERIIEWELAEGMSFPDGASWARIELPDDEFVPVMAIQANDRDHAVDAVRRFREAEAQYSA